MPMMGPIGMMPPPPQEEYDMEVLGGAPPVPLPTQPSMPPDIGGMMSPPPQMMPASSPDWASQLLGASSSPPPPEREVAGGSALMEKKGPSTASKWLNTLAPILAGAAAVLGFKKDSPGGDVLMGIGQGFASHLTEQAKAKRDLQAKSDTATVDLAHKYLASMPGEVDETKYPRLAEMGRNLRESLVNGKLSSPKEAQEFILEFTKYKEDLEQLKMERLAREEKLKAEAPFEAFQEAFEGAKGTDLMAPFMGKYGGGLVEDPRQPGRYTSPSELTAREATARSTARTTAEGERARLDREQRAADAKAAREARSRDVATREAGATARHKDRMSKTGGEAAKDYSAAMKAAMAHARAIDAKRPLGNPEALQKDALEFMAKSGHVVPVRLKNGKQGFYMGAGRVTDNRAEAEAAVKGLPLAMAPPPLLEDEDEEDLYEGE